MQTSLNLSNFSQAHPAVYRCLQAGETNFARSLMQALIRWGSLTERQLAVAQKLATEPQPVAAPSMAGAGLSDLIAAFQRAKASKLKFPAMTFERITIKFAGEKSRTPGHLFVTGGKAFDSVYFGRISPDGVFHASMNAGSAIIDEVARISLDPLGEAIKHGKATGKCACCNRPLSDPISVERGIGPICASKFFGA